MAIHIEQHKNLKEYTTLRVGGAADFFCVVTNEDELKEAIAFAQEKSVPIFTLGGGSNILVLDIGFPGLVIKMEMKGIEYHEETEGTRVVVRAGEEWDALVAQTVEKGLSGLENLSLIPGSVGAAPVQNIGAYGSEVKDTIVSVRAYDLIENIYKDFSNKECEFAYRNSLFKTEAGRYIIVSVTFLLSKNGKLNTSYKDITEYFSTQNITSPTLLDVRNAVVAIRTKKLPDVKQVGTAGSFFKNPILPVAEIRALKEKYPELPVYPVDETHEKISLAWILDKVCGYKGVTRGNVGTYKNQALVIVNNGGATAAEIISFADEIKNIVQEKTGIIIEEEVQRI